MKAHCYSSANFLSQEMLSKGHAKQQDDDNQSGQNAAHFWVHTLDPFLDGLCLILTFGCFGCSHFGAFVSRVVSILIEPPAVISTLRTTYPARSTPSMPRTISSIVNRCGGDSCSRLWELFFLRARHSMAINSWHGNSYVRCVPNFDTVAAHSDYHE